jgi:Zn ribbon nucleic-acid-binding protein
MLDDSPDVVEALAPPCPHCGAQPMLAWWSEPSAFAFGVRSGPRLRCRHCRRAQRQIERDLVREGWVPMPARVGAGHG